MLKQMYFYLLIHLHRLNKQWMIVALCVSLCLLIIAAFVYANSFVSPHFFVEGTHPWDGH